MHSSTLSAGVALALCASCATPQFSATAAIGRLSLEGDFSATEGAASESTNLDTLGLDAPETAIVPRLDADWTSTHLTLSGLTAGFEGSGELEGTITINGTTINGGTQVDTGFDLNAYSGILTWDVLPVGPLEIGLGFGVTVVDLKIDVVADVGGERVATDESFPVPLFAGRVGFENSVFNLGASVGAIDVSVAEGDLELTDVDVFGELELFGSGRRPVGWLVAGYRSFQVAAQYDDSDSQIDADIGLSGPYVGLRLSF